MGGEDSHGSLAHLRPPRPAPAGGFAQDVAADVEVEGEVLLRFQARHRSSLDGEIHLWIHPDKSWIVLFHANGRPIVDKFPDLKEVVSLGSLVVFPNFVASVVSCSISPCGSIQFPPGSAANSLGSDSSPKEDFSQWRLKVKFCEHSK